MRAKANYRRSACLALSLLSAFGFGLAPYFPWAWSVAAWPIVVSLLAAMDNYLFIRTEQLNREF